MKSNEYKKNRPLYNKLHMPNEFRAVLVERNLKLIKQIAPIMIVFSAILILLIRLNIKDNKPSSKFFLSMIFDISTTSFILACIFQKLKKINPIIRNIPLFVFFIGLLFVSTAMVHHGSIPFNGFVTFICIITVTPLVFAIEPYIFNIMLISTSVPVSMKIYYLYGMGAVSNALLFIAVILILALQRWIALKETMLHDKHTKDHDKFIERELEMAAVVQKSFYKHDLSNIKNWEIAYYNDPMVNMSGDLFDFFINKNNLEGLCIFDVSGHGLAAGLVTMLVKNAMEEEFYENEEYELEFTMQCINDRVRREKGNIENYLTGILMRIKNNKIEMVNASHPLPIIYNAKTDTCNYYTCNKESRKGVIGLSDFDYDFKSLEFNLEPNDLIILYTDGVTEAKNKDREEYGSERFLNSVKAHIHLPVQEQISNIVADIKNFIGDSLRTDDISMIILKKI